MTASRHYRHIVNRNAGVSPPMQRPGVDRLHCFVRFACVSGAEASYVYQSGDRVARTPKSRSSELHRLHREWTLAAHDYDRAGAIHGVTASLFCKERSFDPCGSISGAVRKASTLRPE